MRINRQLLQPASSASPRSNSPRSAWHWLSQLTQILICVAAGALIYLFFVPSFDKSREIKREINTYNLEIDKETKRNESLRLEAETLTQDPDTIERLARDRLNLAREDEFVFRFDPYDKKQISNPTLLPKRQEPVW